MRAIFFLFSCIILHVFTIAGCKKSKTASFSRELITNTSSLSNTISSAPQIMNNSEKLAGFCEEIEKAMLRGAGSSLKKAYITSRTNVSQAIFDVKTSKKQVDAKMKIFEKAQKAWVNHIEEIFKILREKGFSDQILWDWSAGYCYKGEKE